MQNYHDLLAAIMERGIDQFNERTQLRCRTLVGQQMEFDLADGLPALTTRKLPFKNIVGELLGFFRGYDNALDFQALGCHFWDANANVTPAWLKNPNRAGVNSLGRIYGKQWTDSRAYREIPAGDEAGANRLLEEGYALVCKDSALAVFRKSINQLEGALRKLLTDPSDRRIIVSGWNVGELDLMCLCPCHIDYRFVAFENPRVLNVVMTIRSWDMLLGAPANCLSTAIFLSIMARLAGFECGRVVIQATNCHIYETHEAQVRELLTRDHFEAPRLVLSDRIKPITDLSEIEGVFERIEPCDIAMEGYQSHAAIKAPMAA